jgi:hypothetical protein
VGGSLRSWSAVIAVPALPILLAALVLRQAIGIPVAVFLLGTAYTVRLLAGAEVLDGRAPLVAAGLFALAELSYWSLELRDGVAAEAGAHLRRVGVVAGLTLGAVVLGAALLALVDVAGTRGLAVEALGVAAAVAALALLAFSPRRTT